MTKPWLIFLFLGYVFLAAVQGETFLTWKERFFSAAQLAEGIATADAADPDNDGIINFLEYAYSGNPLSSDKMSLPFNALVSDQHSLTHRRNPNGEDLVFSLEASDDLFNWHTLSGVSHVTDSSLLDYDLVTLADSQSLNTTQKQFLRLRIETLFLLTARPLADATSLSWNTVGNATHYAVLYSLTGGEPYLTFDGNETTSTNLQFNNTSYGTNLHFIVRAYHGTALLKTSNQAHIPLPVSNETLGTRLRRLARDRDHGNNPNDRPYMKACPPWKPSTVWAQYDVCVNGGNLYVCVFGGTSAPSGGPTGILGGTPTLDGTARWQFFSSNQVTTDPSLTQNPWMAQTNYLIGTQVTANNKVYACVGAGTSSPSSGPNGLTNVVTDGTVTWTYLGVASANSYASVFPTVTFGAGAPSGLSNRYRPDIGDFTALNVQSVSGGSGYAVNDTIRPSGGTYSTQSVFTVTSISNGTVTGLAVATAGKYSILPGTPFPTTQGTTSGSGTGCTMAIRWSDGLPHLSFLNGYLSYQIATGFSGMHTFQPSVNSTPVRQHPAFEFYTDAPAFAIQFTARAGQAIIIDGVRYNQSQIPFGTGNQFVKFDFTNTGGRKKRHIRVESINFINFGSIWVDNDSQAWKPQDLDKVTAVVISESIFAGSNFGPFLAGNSVTHCLAQELGWSNVHHFSQGSAGYCNRGSSPGAGSDVYGKRVAEALVLNPDVWLIAGSLNDRGPGFSASAITAAATSMLQAIRAGGSTAPIIIAGCWPINDIGATTTLEQIETALQSAVTASGDPQTFFLPVRNASPRPWLTGSWNNSANNTTTNATHYLGSDNIHPVDIGTRYLASRLADAIRDTVLPFVE